jgi:cytochrome c peroxidase
MTGFRIGMLLAGALMLAVGAVAGDAAAPPLGLPPVPVPEDNPQTAEKVALGDKLFHDKRFSSTGEVACANCHDAKKAFTDSPLRVSEGINKLTGTRNAPTVVNAAYMKTQFWDGRSPILEIVRTDPEYVKAFTAVFGKSGDGITMDEVTKAIAAFERTQVSGNSPFDRYFYAGEEGALTDAQRRGFDLYVNRGRCVSCHVIEQTQAVFTDGRFHNVGVGINDIQSDVPALAGEYIEANLTKAEVDIAVLTDKRSSELGRFAVTTGFDDLGSFKTPTLRNVAVTAPYMHDGSKATLRDVLVHYNNGGVTNEGDPVNDFLSGGIRPLDLTEDEIDDLVAFMDALTSPEFADLPKSLGLEEK